LVDRISASERSQLMSKVRDRDTTPELAVRRLVREFGVHYRLNVGGLPGTPDLVFPRAKRVIFVHGCFWHRHRCRAGKSMPASRHDYWAAKFDRNRKRDQAARRALRRQGWEVLVIWECQLRGQSVDAVRRRLRRFLDITSDAYC